MTEDNSSGLESYKQQTTQASTHKARCQNTSNCCVKAVMYESFLKSSPILDPNDKHMVNVQIDTVREVGSQ